MPYTQDDDVTITSGNSHDAGTVSREYVKYPRFKKKGSKGDPGFISLFPSNNPSKFAVHAPTGERYDGIYTLTHDAERMFCVMDATAPIQRRMIDGKPTACESKDSNRFYYDSPEEYIDIAKRRGVTIKMSREYIADWHARKRERFGGFENGELDIPAFDEYVQQHVTVIRG